MNKKFLIPIVIILSILIVSIIWLKKGTVKYVTKPVNKGTITLDYAIENSSLPKEEFLSIAKSLGYKL